MRVSVLVPYSSGCEWRAAAWRYVRGHYETHHSDWELIEGCSPDPWSKGLAVRDAYSRAAGGVVVIADADSFVDPSVLYDAVEQVGRHAWVMPHLMVMRLSIHGTRRMCSGDVVHRGHTVRQPYVGLAGGGISVLRRDTYDAVGGIDPRFRGWGGEDVSFGAALETLVGPGMRLAGDLWHLWHPPAAPRRRGSPESEALVGRYQQARGNPDVMRALIEEATNELAKPADSDSDNRACHRDGRRIRQPAPRLG